MNNSYDMDTIRANFLDVPAIENVCRKFDFPPEYYSVFVQLHCCGAGHFENPGLPAEIIEQVLEALDFTEHAALVNAILTIQNDTIRDTLVMMCSEELLVMVYPPSELEILEMMINQIDNLGFLYGKAGFRDHMVALYNFYVKPFLADFQVKKEIDPLSGEEAKVPKPRVEKLPEIEQEFPGEELL